jgi:hypothetical protein
VFVRDAEHAKAADESEDRLVVLEVEVDELEVDLADRTDVICVASIELLVAGLGAKQGDDLEIRHVMKHQPCAHRCREDAVLAQPPGNERRLIEV